MMNVSMTDPSPPLRLSRNSIRRYVEVIKEKSGHMELDKMIEKEKR